MKAKLIIFLLIGIIIGMMLGGILSPTIAQEDNYQLGNIESYLADISSRIKNIETYTKRTALNR